MGQWYQIGLQCGKNIESKIDKFIKKNPDFVPKAKIVMCDGTIVYSWYIKWNPSIFHIEVEFLKLLREFDELNFYEMSDEDYFANAYKLIGAGDEGGEINEGNESGYDLFDDLYITHDVHLPE